MNLAVFLAIGESLKDFKKKGQDSLIIDNNFRSYSKNFKNVYIFSYARESFKLFDNVYVLPNKYKIHRYIYSLVLPFLHFWVIKKCNVVRCYQLTGGIPGFIVKLFIGKKYIVNYGYDYVTYASIEGKRIRSLITQCIKLPILFFADYIIATTDDLKQYALKFNRNVTVIPNGVDINLFKPFKSPKSIDILYVGRLEKQKNLELLIKSVSLVKNKKIKIIFIGSGSFKNHLNNLSRVYKVNLTIIPRITNKLLPGYYNRAKIFVLPSLIEGNPKSLIEAMSCGLPVIGNNVSGISSVINNKNGLLFNNSIESLVDILSSILTNTRKRNSLGKVARKFVENNYSFNKLFNKEIYLIKKYS